MMANNETGVIQPIKEIVQMVKTINESRKENNQFEILTHTDAAQTFGKIPVSVKECPVDYITIVGHKVLRYHYSGVPEHTGTLGLLVPTKFFLMMTIPVIGQIEPEVLACPYHVC